MITTVLIMTASVTLADAASAAGLTPRQALILAAVGIAGTFLAAVVPAVVSGRAERRAVRAGRLRADLIQLRDHAKQVTLAGKAVQEAAPGSKKVQIQLREALLAVQADEGLIYLEDIRTRSRTWREYAEKFYAGAPRWTSQQEAVLLGELMDAIGAGYRELRVTWFVKWYRPWPHRLG